MGKRLWMAAALTLLVIGLPGCSWLFRPPEQVVYVNATSGNDDTGTGTENNPYRTITRALDDPRLKPGWEVQLGPGTYDTALGEEFPILLPPGVTVTGAGPEETRIISSYATMDEFDSPIVIGGEGSALVEVGVSNDPPGYGVGFYTDTSGRVEGCEFSYLNAGVWLQGGNCSVLRNSIHHTLTDTGITIMGENASLIEGNHLVHNDVGILVKDTAHPTLRNNLIENSSHIGIIITDMALPDLGTESSPGRNVISGSGDYHLLAERRFVASFGSAPKVTDEVPPPIPAVGNTWDGIAPTGSVCGPLDVPPYFSLRDAAVAVTFSEGYDLLANAPLAHWYTIDDHLSYPGSPGDPSGAVVPLASAVLEDGNTYSGVLATYPPQGSDVWIAGEFPLEIPERGVFVADFGFLAGAAATDGVTVKVHFSPAPLPTLSNPAGVSTTLISEHHVYEGRLLHIAADLSSLSGARGTLIISVFTGASSDHDWAAWVRPRVYRSASP